tara:strand:+ start:335 stop:724 length:390 start_codon:yes stop_codon:yes gene_type:complete
MEIKILPRETVLLAKNHQLLINWYINNLNFKIINNNSDIKYCNLETDSGIKIGIADMEQMGNENYSKRIMNTVILQICTNDLKKLFKRIKNNGGSVLFGPSYDEGDKYWYGSITDIEGNEIWVVDENCP